MLTLLLRILRKSRNKRDSQRRERLATKWDGMSSLIKAITRQILEPPVVVLTLEPRRLNLNQQHSQALPDPFSSREVVDLPLSRNPMPLATKPSSLHSKEARVVRPTKTINLLKSQLSRTLLVVNNLALVTSVCLLHLQDSKRHPEKNVKFKPPCPYSRVRQRLAEAHLKLLPALKRPRLTITTLVSWCAMWNLRAKDVISMVTRRRETTAAMRRTTAIAMMMVMTSTQSLRRRESSRRAMDILSRKNNSMITRTRMVWNQTTSREVMPQKLRRPRKLLVVVILLPLPRKLLANQLNYLTRLTGVMYSEISETKLKSCIKSNFLISIQTYTAA